MHIKKYVITVYCTPSLGRTCEACLSLSLRKEKKNTLMGLDLAPDIQTLFGPTPRPKTDAMLFGSVCCLHIVGYLDLAH